METIKIFVEQLISLTGLTGPSVHIARHLILILVAILLAWMSDVICRKVFVPIVHKITTHTEAQWDDVLFNKRVLISACHIVPAIVIWWLLPLVFYQYPTVRELLTRLTAIYITVMSVRTIIVFIDAFNQLETANRSSAQQYLKTFRGVLRIVILFIAAIIVIAVILGKSPMTLIAGLGATSAILMLVFKDTISGLVAGIRLTSNDMVHKGDWITVPGTEANGVVEEITLTTVKVRNFDNTIVTVSPLTLVDDSFQNWIGMQQGEGRRVKRKVFFDFRSIRVADDEMKKHLEERDFFTAKSLQGEHINISLYRQYVEKTLSEHADVNTDMTVMVRQLEATQCGLPLEFYFFLKQKDWKPYEHHLADIMERIYTLAPEFGLKIYQQYPEQ
jgi:miniconductance mechanosensitive channel